MEFLERVQQRLILRFRRLDRLLLRKIRYLLFRASLDLSYLKKMFFRRQLQFEGRQFQPLSQLVEPLAKLMPPTGSR